MHRASRENAVVRYAVIIRGMERRTRMGTTITVERVVDSMTVRHVVLGRTSGGTYVCMRDDGCRGSGRIWIRVATPTAARLLSSLVASSRNLPVFSLSISGRLPISRLTLFSSSCVFSAVASALPTILSAQFLLQFPLRRPLRFLLVGFRFSVTCDSYDSYSKA